MGRDSRFFFVVVVVAVVCFWGISPATPMGSRAALALAESGQGSLSPQLGFQLCFLQLHHKSLGSIRQPYEALDDSLAANNLMHLRQKNSSFGEEGRFDSTVTSLKYSGTSNH